MSEKFINDERVAELWSATKDYVDNKPQYEAGEGIDFIAEGNQNKINVREPVISLTQAEYEALTDEEKQTGLYIVTDAKGGNGSSGGGMTEEEADERYLQLTGGAMTGDISFVAPEVGWISRSIEFNLPGDDDKYLLQVRPANEFSGEGVFVFRKYNNALAARIRVADPKDLGDAATKSYVDSAIGAAINEAMEASY